MGEWDHDKILKLVGLYEIKPELWDPTNNNFHIRNKKHDAWTEVANELEREINDIKAKMTSLLSSFRREKVKMKNSLKTGSGTQEVYVSKWFAFPAFAFLMEKDKIKETTDTENDITEQHDIPEPLSNFEAEAEGSVAAESVSRQNSESEVQDAPPSSPIPTTSQHSPSVPTRKRKLFLSPKKKLPLKKKSTEEDPRVAYAYNVLKAVSDTPKNECTTFGQHIATKLEKFKDPLRSVVIHKINNIIFEAEIGKYNDYVQNIHVNEPSMAPSSFTAPVGYNSDYNYEYSRRFYSPQIHALPPHPNYNYSQGSYNLQTNISSPNSTANYSNESCISQTNLTSPGSNSNHSNTSFYNPEPQLGTLEGNQVETTEEQTPLQVLVKSFDPNNTNV